MIDIQAFLERANIRQNQMAEILNVAPSTLNNWVKGIRDVPSDVIRELFVMGATVEELFNVECPCKRSTQATTDGDIQRMIADEVQKAVKQALEKNHSKAG